jgi:hypothetical protein
MFWYIAYQNGTPGAGKSLFSGDCGMRRYGCMEMLEVKVIF